jgi:hypothetical protein
MIDFTGIGMSPYRYEGADRKHAIMMDGRHYMLKLRKRLKETANPLQAGYASNPASEHIGCEVFRSVGLPVQKTVLGLYEGSLAVACEDFILNDAALTGKGWGVFEFASAMKGVFDSIGGWPEPRPQAACSSPAAAARGRAGTGGRPRPQA